MVPRNPREAEAVLMPLRAMPDDFKEHLHETQGQLRVRYSTGPRMVRRWLTEAGVIVGLKRNGWTTGTLDGLRVNPPRQRGPIRAARHRVDVKSFLPQADSSVSGRAADFLKRYFVPVCKSETVGKTPGSYIVGHMGMLPTDEMIALAKRKGFDPSAWSRVA